MKKFLYFRAIALSLAGAALLSACVVQPVAPGPVYVDPAPVYVQPVPYPGVVYSQPYGVAPAFGLSLNYSQGYGGWRHHDHGGWRGGRPEARHDGWNGRRDWRQGGRHEARRDRRHGDR